MKDSRPTDDGSRRFVAAARAPPAAQRFTTVERVQLREITVVKSDQPPGFAFDRDKLARSIRVALNKRPVQRGAHRAGGQCHRSQARIEWRRTEVTSTQIGELVMETLKEVDAVAYVRFASVYRNFREAADFGAFLGSLGEPT